MYTVYTFKTAIGPTRNRQQPLVSWESFSSRAILGSHDQLAAQRWSFCHQPKQRTIPQSYHTFALFHPKKNIQWPLLNQGGMISISPVQPWHWLSRSAKRFSKCSLGWGIRAKASFSSCCFSWLSFQPQILTRGIAWIGNTSGKPWGDSCLILQEGDIVIRNKSNDWLCQTLLKSKNLCL